MSRTFNRSATLADSTSQTPTVTTTFGLVGADGLLNGVLLGAFQGYDPAVTGNLALALGQSAYDVGSVDPAASALQHVVADSPVVDPTVVTDLAWSTPSNGPDNGSSTDIGIASSTKGFASLVLPLEAAIANTTLGQELSPLLDVAGALLPKFGANNGVPKGGSTTAKPLFELAAGASLASTTTLFGITTTTSAAGSLTIDQLNANALISTAADGSQLFSDAGTLISDVQSGNIIGAITEGIATLADGTKVIGDVTTLIQDAGGSETNPLPAIKNPQLSLNVAIGDSQSFNLGLGTPTQLNEQLNVQITGDQFGAYALGKLLALYAPTLIADLSNGGISPEATFAQLAQGVATLTQDMTSGNLQPAPGIPSSTNKPDIAISATLVTTEDQNLIGGNASATQTFSLNFDTNAQGLYDLGTAAQSAVVALLVGLLETPGGEEALNIGGQILSQVDTALGGGGNAHHPAAIASSLHEHMISHW
ncbi:MAG TPA: hypothetical protein VMB71_08115 [Acetobacteraceae bacterium]|nr:hypothetical protein [Acetobacteraceae bacterium]